MLSVIYSECHLKTVYAECHYSECRYAECRYAECCYAQCCSAGIILKPSKILSNVHNVSK
jgi:hypothetical protein